MLLFVRDKVDTSADEKMLQRLKVRHEFLHSNRIDAIGKRLFFSEKQKKLPFNKGKLVSHLIFDVNYMFEQNDTDFFSLLERIRENAPEISVVLYYYTKDEYLLSRNIEALRQLGYADIVAVDDINDFLKKLNLLVVTDELAQLVPPIQFRNAGCVSVGVLGGCQRIGTTTQAMQLQMFLQNSGYRVGLIQWVPRPDLKSYVEVVTNAKLLSPSEFVINGLRFYGKEDLKVAINDNDFLLFDFGAIGLLEEAELDFFRQMDIKIAVLGVKHSEVAHFADVFELDGGGELRYIYSFIAPPDREDVKRQMEERSKDTYFADYTPDYFQYSENDTMYSKMLGVTLLQKPPNKKTTKQYK